MTMAADFKMADWQWIEALPAKDAPQDRARNSGRASAQRKPRRLVSLPALPPPSQERSQGSGDGMPWPAQLAVAFVVMVIGGLIAYAAYMVYQAIVERPFAFLLIAAIIGFAFYKARRG